MKYSSRLFLYAPLALFLSLAAIVMVHWFMVAGVVDKKLVALKGHDVIPGVTLDWSKVTINGFPFRIDLIFDDLLVKGAGPHGPFAWKTEHFATHALTYGRDTHVMEAAGNQRLSWTDAAGKPHEVAFIPASLRASAVHDSRGLARLDLDIIGAGAKDFTAGRLQFHMRRNPDGKSIDLMASADDLQNRAGIAFFGAHIRILRVYTTLTDGNAFMPLLAGEATPAAADTTWQQTGGEARVEKLQVESSNLTITTGNIGLHWKFADLLSPLY